jgi:hypothetical protein
VVQPGGLDQCRARSIPGSAAKVGLGHGIWRGDLRERGKSRGQACVRAVVFVLVRTSRVAGRVR